MSLIHRIWRLLRELVSEIDRGHDFYGPVPVSRWTATYPCRRCGAHFPALRRCTVNNRSTT